MIYAPRFAKLVDDAKQQIAETTAAAVAAQIAGATATATATASVAALGFLLIDIREDHEWVKGCLPCALHLGRGILERDIETLAADPAANIIVYCGGGGRSALAALSLKQMGYSNVTSMAGGYRGWLEAGHPTLDAAAAVATHQ